MSEPLGSVDCGAVQARSQAWSPGVQSSIPADLQPLVTLFRSDNSIVSYTEALELSELFGLNPLEFVALRLQRLVVHELLVRVTSDLSVPDGPNYEDLGINLRAMVQALFERHIVAELDTLGEKLEFERHKARHFIDEQLALQLFSGSEKSAKPESLAANPGTVSWFERLQSVYGTLTLKKPSRKIDSPIKDSQTIALEALASWQEQLELRDDPLEQSCLSNLIKYVGAMLGHRGRVVLEQPLLCKVVTNQVCNKHGAQLLEQWLDPLVTAAISAENYRVLPAQTKPVIMNVKGASASGKSTIRPQQRQLAEELGIPWEDFALISPDYWRKYLLSYESLGDDHKYGAMLTGQELEIIDKKLDRYMAKKAASGEIPHLLIDRFRFDSFKTGRGGAADSQLLSRFGDRIFLFLMITPPQETVIRAWKRGLTTGRYKAVDDLLYHNVEAFTGMPPLFFSWVNSQDKDVHFEFLDNDVPLGELPRTVAFGSNHCMTILDVSLMLNIERYRKLNVDATQEHEVFAGVDLQASANIGFILHCAENVREVNFADPTNNSASCVEGNSDCVANYACIRNNQLVWWDQEYLDRMPKDTGLYDALVQLGYTGQQCSGIAAPQAGNVVNESSLVGRWP